ncbi:hypothetical protein [Sphingobacterium mizutaii]|uniref:hypothetical protein n=1 Tax=Sphingobacterium mizutaii TaxID=1010 RepID=UPI0016253AF2|nr:hypothetical protein [Sphingobacterium mizutaii]
MQEKKGVATFFLPGCCPFPQGSGGFRASWFLWVRHRGTRAVRTKTQLAHYKTKKWGYTPKGKKVGWGVFLAHGFGDGQYISEYRDVYVSIYLNTYISEHRDVYVSIYLNTYISEHRDVYVSIYLNTYISEYLCIRISGYLHI